MFSSCSVGHHRTAACASLVWTVLHVFVLPYVIQAYTSQFVSLVMFALMMSEDKLSLQPRRLEIIKGLRVLPGQSIEHQKQTF